MQLSEQSIQRAVRAGKLQDFTQTIILPICKNKIGDMSDAGD